MTIRDFFGGLLVAIGWLGAILSGGCTFVFSLNSIANASFQDLGLFLMVGGIPFIICVALVWAGKAIIRSQKRDEQN